MSKRWLWWILLSLDFRIDSECSGNFLRMFQNILIETMWMFWIGEFSGKSNKTISSISSLFISIFCLLYSCFNWIDFSFVLSHSLDVFWKVNRCWLSFPLFLFFFFLTQEESERERVIKEERKWEKRGWRERRRIVPRMFWESSDSSFQRRIFWENEEECFYFFVSQFLFFFFQKIPSSFFQEILSSFFLSEGSQKKQQLVFLH